jgi:hypothetical protein
MEESNSTLFPQSQNTSAHNAIVLNSGTATDSDNASKNGRVGKLVSIALYAVWLTSFWLPVIRENIFRCRQKLPLPKCKFDTPMGLQD